MSSSPIHDRLTRSEEYAWTAFASITLYNSIELIILTLATFKKYQGVYFWSLLISSCSLIVNCLGWTLTFFVDVTDYVSITIVLLGWYCLTTGHSMVLWSRLHLVLQSPKMLRWLLYLIIFDAIILQIPTTVLLYGTVSYDLSVQPTFSNAYSIIERIQLVVFALQEVLLSSIYIWETTKLLRLRPQHTHRIILTQLLIINIIILGLDIVVVVFQYAGLFALQVCFKPVAYSIKLRLEYAILGRLVEVAKGASPGGTGAGAGPLSGYEEVAWAGFGHALAGEFSREGAGASTGASTGVSTGEESRSSS
ncbi:hypothetical protein BDV18DRAFT_158218 [Aspergillus unguis]